MRPRQRTWALGSCDAEPATVETRAAPAHLELAGAAEPHVVLAGQVGHAVAALVDGEAAGVAADQLVGVEVHLAVAHRAAVARPAHLPRRHASMHVSAEP